MLGVGSDLEVDGGDNRGLDRPAFSGKLDRDFAADAVGETRSVSVGPRPERSRDRARLSRQVNMRWTRPFIEPTEEARRSSPTVGMG